MAPQVTIQYALVDYGSLLVDFTLDPPDDGMFITKVGASCVPPELFDRVEIQVSAPKELFRCYGGCFPIDLARVVYLAPGVRPTVTVRADCEGVEQVSVNFVGTTDRRWP